MNTCIKSFLILMYFSPLRQCNCTNNTDMCYILMQGYLFICPLLLYCLRYLEKHVYNKILHNFTQWKLI